MVAVHRGGRLVGTPWQGDHRPTPRLTSLPPGAGSAFKPLAKLEALDATLDTVLAAGDQLIGAAEGHDAACCVRATSLRWC